MSPGRLSILLGTSALLLAALVVALRNRDDPPSGEGSYAAAARIRDDLETIKSGRTPPHSACHRFELENGAWYLAIGTDSHGGPDGGTVGVLTSDGDIAVFFTHVCGRGPLPLEFPGHSPAELIALLRSTHTEYHP